MFPTYVDLPVDLPVLKSGKLRKRSLLLIVFRPTCTTQLPLDWSVRVIEVGDEKHNDVNCRTPMVKEVGKPTDLHTHTSSLKP